MTVSAQSTISFALLMFSAALLFWGSISRTFCPLCDRLIQFALPGIGHTEIVAGFEICGVQFRYFAIVMNRLFQ